MVQDTEERRSYVKRCLSCGQRGGRYAEPVTAINPGDDALAAVAAQTLIEALPPPANRESDAPMKGRNLLVFADNRQDAAFFAPFFERTARDQALRAAMVEALKRAEDEKLDLEGLKEGVWRALRREGFRLYDRRNPEPLGNSAVKDRLLALIAGELCNGALRLSLETLGLMPDFGRKKESETREAREGFVRTLSEALRLAATDLLETDPRDIRATAEIPTGHPSVILSDAVPGGAGYCRRLLADDEPRFSARALVGRALQILECPSGDTCETSCPHCLNDFSNQQHWDKLNRHPVRAWLSGVLAQTQPRPVKAPADVVPIANTAAETIGLRLQGASLVIVAAQALWGAQGHEQAAASLRALRRWLDDDRARKVYYLIPDAADIAGAGSTGLDRRLVDGLVEYERNAQIEVHLARADRLAAAPRLTVVKQSAAEEFWADVGAPPVLEGPLGGVSHFGRRALAESWIGCNIRELSVRKGVLEAFNARIRRFDYRPGTPRDLGPVFDAVSGRQVDLHIEDPWCLARPLQREKLEAFLTMLKKQGVQVRRLTLVWEPANTPDLPPRDQIEAAEQHLGRKGLFAQLRPEPSDRNRRRHFHDRFVEATTVDALAPLKARFDITAGIDNLMALQKECAVFLTVERL